MRRCDGCGVPPDDRRWFNERTGESLCWNCETKATDQRRMPQARSRFVAAIRRFTAEARDVAGELVSNGPFERALLDLDSAMGAQPPGLPVSAHAWVMRMAEAAARVCETAADDCQELREAAEGYFGGDFRAPSGGAS